MLIALELSQTERLNLTERERHYLDSLFLASAAPPGSALSEDRPHDGFPAAWAWLAEAAIDG